MTYRLSGLVPGAVMVAFGWELGQTIYHLLASSVAHLWNYIF